VALLRAKKSVGKLTNANADVPGRHQHRAQGIGGRRFARSPRIPASRARSWSTRSRRTSPRRLGFDAQTEGIRRHARQGIVDPAKVVRAALQDAASIAGLLVTTEAMVAELPKDQPAMPAMPGGGGGMGGMGF